MRHIKLIPDNTNIGFVRLRYWAFGITMTRTLALTVAALALVLVVPSGYGAGDIDRTAVDFKTPSEIKWVRNAAGTNESAVLFGDPSKPGPYVVRVKWFPGNMTFRMTSL